jgi:hypothetical protein
MGTVSSPGVPKPAVPAGSAGTPSPDDSPGESVGSAQTASRFKFQGRERPLGPSLLTIFGVLAAAGIGTWLYVKAPSEVADVVLSKYVAFESPLKQGSPRDCRASAGCLLVYVGTDANSVATIPAALELAEALKPSGVETVFVVGRDQLKECARVARTFRQPVLLDSEGKLARTFGMAQPQFWVVYDGLGNLKLRTEEAVSVPSVRRTLGL